MINTRFKMRIDGWVLGEIDQPQRSLRSLVGIHRGMRDMLAQVCAGYKGLSETGQGPDLPVWMVVNLRNGSLRWSPK